jgi:hypothetical protein
MQEKITKPTEYFGENLAILLANKITIVYPNFDSKKFTITIKKNCGDKTLTQRVELIADTLKAHLPADYKKAILKYLRK